jgi:hypothetical protein
VNKEGIQHFSDLLLVGKVKGSLERDPVSPH